MNRIKDIEVEIYNLGSTPNPDKLLGLINQMQSYVNTQYSYPHPLLEPERLGVKIREYKSRYFRDVEEFKVIQYYVQEYCESCQNFILRNRDSYWNFLDFHKQKVIEYQIITCVRFLKKMCFEHGYVLTNLGSLESISSAKPQYEKFEDFPYIRDSDLLEIIDESNSAPKTVAILHLSGVLDVLKSSLDVDNLSDLSRLLALTFNLNPGTLRRALGDLQTQLNGIGDVRNTAFTESQNDFIEKIVKTLKGIGLSEERIRSRIPSTKSGDE